MCGMKMTPAASKMASEYVPEAEEKPEVEVSIEGDAKSVRSVLEKLIPKEDD
jgi:hypothetical protein